jgi:hypothetical protein
VMARVALMEGSEGSDGLRARLTEAEVARGAAAAEAQAAEARAAAAQDEASRAVRELEDVHDMLERTRLECEGRGAEVARCRERLAELEGLAGAAQECKARDEELCAAHAELKAAHRAQGDAASHLRQLCDRAVAALVESNATVVDKAVPHEAAGLDECTAALSAHVEALADALTGQHTPPSLPASHTAGGGPSPPEDVAVDLGPLLRNSPYTASSSSRRPTGIVQRRDGADHSPRDSVPSPGPSDTLFFRPLRSIPIFRKLPLRVQAALSRVDEGAYVSAYALVEVPAVRIGFVSWLLALHLYVFFLQSRCSLV